MLRLDTPFSQENTHFIPELMPLLQRAAAGGLNAPWIVVPIQEALQHCNISSLDAQHKLVLMAMHDAGVEFLVLPPEQSEVDDALGGTFRLTERADVPPADSLF